MAALELKKLNSAHHAMAAWLVMNPGANDQECARALGYTQGYVSRVINSNMFQAYYEQLKNQRDLPAIHSIQDKMAYNTHLALDRMKERLELPGPSGASERFIGRAAETLLDRLGFGGKGDIHVHQHNDRHIHLTADAINSARERARAVNSGEMLPDGT